MSCSSSLDTEKSNSKIAPKRSEREAKLAGLPISVIDMKDHQKRIGTPPSTQTDLLYIIHPARLYLHPLAGQSWITAERLCPVVLHAVATTHQTPSSTTCLRSRQYRKSFLPICTLASAGPLIASTGHSIDVRSSLR